MSGSRVGGDLGPICPGHYKDVGFIRKTGLLPFENHKAVGFIRNTGLLPFENHKGDGFIRDNVLLPL